MQCSRRHRVGGTDAGSPYGTLKRSCQRGQHCCSRLDSLLPHAHLSHTHCSWALHRSTGKRSHRGVSRGIRHCQVAPNHLRSICHIPPSPRRIDRPPSPLERNVSGTGFSTNLTLWRAYRDDTGRFAVRNRGRMPDRNSYIWQPGSARDCCQRCRGHQRS